MALSGLDIYKLLPKTNCKECGFATCLAFAMALAQKKSSLDKCPHITAAAREALESASQPPIKLVTIGVGERKIEIGNETVMYRHEQKFYHPAAVGFVIEDTASDADIDTAIREIDSLEFERVGQKIAANLICVRNASKDRARMANAVGRAAKSKKMCLALEGSDPAVMAEAVALIKDTRPLIICTDPKQTAQFAEIARANGAPLAVTASSVDEAAQMTEIAKRAGVSEIVINLNEKDLSKKIQDFTNIRHSGLKKNLRALGYPILAFCEETSPRLELAEAVSYVLKYAGIVIMKNRAGDIVFPLLTARQDIYQDPQKPVQVEPKIYEIGKVTKDSPVAVTTNFSITYFTVAGEVESSKVPSYILVCDSEGMSVLTAWAAEKFTAERIAESLKKSGLEGIVSHRKVIIPGYVSVLSGRLEEVSGWKVSVGPREASGIPNYLRNFK